jgi:hypothetical protein
MTQQKQPQNSNRELIYRQISGEALHKFSLTFGLIRAKFIQKPIDATKT